MASRLAAEPVTNAPSVVTAPVVAARMLPRFVSSVAPSTSTLELILKTISPFKLKILITTLIALFIYWPLARLSYFFEKLGYDISNMPISSYKDVSFYTMKTDALDRFGTKLEKRFTKTEILEMMERSGLKNIKFRDNPPFWVAVGEKN